MATRRELNYWYKNAAHCKKGYCCQQDAPQGTLIELGYNAGIYGWNWTAYFHPDTDTLYISCYRNVPSYIAEK